MKRNKMRFKFIIPIILAVIVIAGIISIGLKSSNIYAAYTDTSNGNNVTYTLSKTTLKITGSGKVTDAWKNSSLNSELSNLQTSITAVSIAKTITGIEASAFEGCTALTKVTFASGAKCISIGNKAFKGCTALTNIVNVTTSNTLPKTITTIGNEAFSGCVSLEKIAFAKYSTCTSIGNEAFSGCVSLEKITFAKDSTCTSIGNKAFKGCTALTNIVDVTTSNTLPKTITTIGNEAFSGCVSLEKIAFAKDSTCTSIGNSAFDGCTSLTNVTIPDGVKKIDSAIFKDFASSLTTVGIRYYHN